MKKKIIEIVILIICILAIIFAGCKIFGININFGLNTNEDDNLIEDDDSILGFGSLITTWKSEKCDIGYRLIVGFYDDDSVNIAFDGGNAFFKIEDFENVTYKSDVVFEDATYESRGDAYSSVVPNDCQGVEVDGVFYESKNAEVSVDGSVISFKYVMADLEHKKDLDHGISLVDKDGNLHKID